MGVCAGIAPLDMGVCVCVGIAPQLACVDVAAAARNATRAASGPAA